MADANSLAAQTTVEGDIAAEWTAIVPVGLDLPGPQPPSPAPVTVLEYKYFMDGRYTGTLFLKQPRQQCAWCSARTDITTAWHGEWHTFPSNTTVCIFNFEGRAHAITHTALFRDGRGNDYRGRAIQVVKINYWVHDNVTAQYVPLS